MPDAHTVDVKTEVTRLRRGGSVAVRRHLVSLPTETSITRFPYDAATAAKQQATTLWLSAGDAGASKVRRMIEPGPTAPSHLLSRRGSQNDTLPTYEQLTRTVIAGIVRYQLENPSWPNQRTFIIGDGGDNNKCYNCGGKHKSWDCPKIARCSRPPPRHSTTGSTERSSGQKASMHKFGADLAELHWDQT